MKAIDQYYINLKEPYKSCFLALSEIILKLNKEIDTSLKYGMPFFSYKGKMLCYFWVHKKFKQPYISWVDGGLIEHPDLLQEKRARMKILLFDPTKDLPIVKIKQILEMAIKLRQEK